MSQIYLGQWKEFVTCVGKMSNNNNKKTFYIKKNYKMYDLLESDEKWLSYSRLKLESAK